MNWNKSFPGPAAFFTAGPEIYIAYNFTTNCSTAIKRENAYKYSQISGIKTDENHLEELLNLKDPSWEIRKYEKLITYLKKVKLLIPLPDIQDNDKQKSDPKHEIAVITCERPGLLKTSLETIAEGVMMNTPEIPLIVFDDSVIEEYRIKNRKTAAETGDKYQIKISCFGKNEKDSFIKTLLPGLKEEESIEKTLSFALFGDQKFSYMKGPGRNRNAALLKLSGKKIIIFDDDIKYLFTTPPEVNNSIEISAKKNPDKNIFPDMKQVMNNCRFAKYDALNYMNGVLGKSITDLMKKTEKSGGLIISDGFRPEPGYSSVEENTVKAAVFGIYGGRWYSRPYGVLFAEGTKRNKVFKKKSEYNKIKENPLHLMLAEHLTLSRTASFIAAAAGLDASEILPPFPPYGRNSDGIWVSVLLALNRKALISHLPLAVFHDFASKHSFIKNDYKDTSASFGIITVLIIDNIVNKLLRVLPEITYETLGNQLISLSKLSDSGFLTLSSDVWLEYTGNLIERLEQLQIKYKGKPRYWKKDVDNYSEILAEQALLPENSLPVELREHYSTEESVKLYKIFFNDYGRLITIWPVIWEKAKNLT